jgi:3-deoxy-7-phosphoheptulonate synthase
MMISMNSDATLEQVEAVSRRVEEMGYRPHVLTGTSRYAIAVTGNPHPGDSDPLSQMPGVAEVLAISKSYKLVSRETKHEDTVVHFENSEATIGAAELAMMGGPCGVESRDQLC